MKSVRNMCRSNSITKIQCNNDIIVGSREIANLFETKYLFTVATDLIFLHFFSPSLKCSTCSHNNSSFFFALVDEFEMSDVIRNLPCKKFTDLDKLILRYDSLCLGGNNEYVH